MSKRYEAKIGGRTISSNVPFTIMQGGKEMSHRYEAKIGGRTIISDTPFDISYGKDNQFRQESQKVYYKTEYDSPERQKLSSYDNKNTSYKQYISQPKIQNQNFQFPKMFYNCDFRGSNIYVNYNK